MSHSGGADDSRLTRTGRFLRAHHLDELPQLWNVFIGDMAFIGPRPERKYYIDRIMEHDQTLCMSVPDSSRGDVVCDAVQRVHGHDGEDAAQVGVRPILFEAPLVVVGYENSGEHLPVDCLRQEVLKE